MILVIDNYDSFVYNLVQYLGEVTDDVVVKRNDVLDLADVRGLDPDGIVVSPGPGHPADAGVCVDLFAETNYPALGVCLGHQALCAANGARVEHAPAVVHGKPSTVRHDARGIFTGVPDPFQAGRYHSLAVDRTALPECLIETAFTDDERQVVMGVRHRDRPHVGVQFHPESILTGRIETEPAQGEPASLELGKRIIANFVESCTTT